MLHAAGIDGFTRALIVSAISTCVGYCGAAVLGSSRRGLRLLGWTLALACFFSPPLLVGYVYSNFTPVGLASEGMRNLFYGVLLSARIVPVAAVVWMMCPGRVTREAWHCLHLLWPSLGSGERIRHVWHMLRRGLPASAVVVFGISFVLSFTEFELASFLSVSQWTVDIFDAQVGGMLLSKSLWLAALPAAVAALVIFGSLFVAGVGRVHAAEGGGRERRRSFVIAGLVWFAATAVLAVIIPFSLLLHGSWSGIMRLGSDFALLPELSCSLIVSAIAACLAVAVAYRVVSRGGLWRRFTGVALLLPGLMGGLVSGLCMLALLQLPLMWHLRETPLPLIVVAALMAFPPAFLMRLLLLRHAEATDIFAAGLLLRSPQMNIRRRAVNIDWVRCKRPLFFGTALLLCYLYCDVTLASFLAPVNMPMVMPRIYNFMHYGRSHMLSASLLLCVVVPLTLLLVVASLYRFGRACYAAAVES